MPLTLEEKKELIVDNIDPDLLVEIFNISTQELLDAFEGHLEEKWYEFAYLEEELFIEDLFYDEEEQEET